MELCKFEADIAQVSDPSSQKLLKEFFHINVTDFHSIQDCITFGKSFMVDRKFERFAESFLTTQFNVISHHIH